MVDPQYANKHRFCTLQCASPDCVNNRPHCTTDKDDKYNGKYLCVCKAIYIHVQQHSEIQQLLLTRTSSINFITNFEIQS